jgi:hypothetical protein
LLSSVCLLESAQSSSKTQKPIKIASLVFKKLVKVPDPSPSAKIGLELKRVEELEIKSSQVKVQLKAYARSLDVIGQGITRCYRSRDHSML